VLRHVDELTQHRGGQRTIPIGLARDATNGVNGVSPHSGNGIVKAGRDRGDGADLGHMVEDLDAPPTDARVGIRETLDNGTETVFAERCRTEVRRRYASG
jgi:hypothetical protein